MLKKKHRFTRSFLVSIDASRSGLGALHPQVSEGHDIAITVAFDSKSLNYALSRYPDQTIFFRTQMGNLR